RQRTQGLAVVAVLKRDEQIALAPLIAVRVEAHLQRDFDSRGTVVREECLAEPRRRQRQQPLGQLDGRRMTEAGQDDLFELARLLCDGSADSGMGMAEQVGPPAADRVEIPLAGYILHPAAFAAAD